MPFPNYSLPLYKQNMDQPSPYVFQNTATQVCAFVPIPNLKFINMPQYFFRALFILLCTLCQGMFSLCNPFSRLSTCLRTLTTSYSSVCEYWLCLDILFHGWWHYKVLLVVKLEWVPTRCCSVELKVNLCL